MLNYYLVPTEGCLLMKQFASFIPLDFSFSFFFLKTKKNKKKLEERKKERYSAG